MNDNAIINPLNKSPNIKETQYEYNKMIINNNMYATIACLRFNLFIHLPSTF